MYASNDERFLSMTLSMTVECRKCRKLLTNYDVVEGAFLCPKDGFYSGYGILYCPAKYKQEYKKRKKDSLVQ